MLEFSTMTEADQSDQVAIEVHLSKSDIFHSVLLTTLKHPLFWIASVGMGVIVYSVLAPQPYGWLLAVITSLGFLFLVPYSRSTSTAKQPGVLAPITYIFSSDGVTAQFENGANKAAWSLVKGATETNKYIFVQMQRGSFHLLPKGSINAEQDTRLRKILRERLSEKARLSR